VSKQPLKKVAPNQPLKKVAPNQPLKKVAPNQPLKKVCQINAHAGSSKAVKIH